MKSPQSLLFSNLNKPNSLNLFVGEMLQPSNHLHPSYGPAPTALNPSWIDLLGVADLGTVLQMEPHKGRAETYNHLPRPAYLPFYDAAQDTVGLPGCRSTLLAHVQLFVHQNLQVFLIRAALNEFFSQSVDISRIAPTQVEHLALGLVEPHLSTAPLSLLSSANLLKVHSIPLSWSLIQMLKSTSSKTEP